ncbi:sensory box histidine kinase/response regulator [hydrocarbon metagenome]|uniref:Sensory box histidine kinase/response regulator n=1 Tax=hydrocarbon metagenome TaxID=938273 RepID=A0A0W8FWR3_9ZZZZ
MGGKIGAESEVCDLPVDSNANKQDKKSGSTFWIELPQTESQKNRYERIIDITEPEAELTQKSGTILYIEDNLSNIHLVNQILETHRPFLNLLTNIYGKNAVQLSIDYKPELILLDLDLPDIHGSEVINLLRAEPRTANIPVIIISADATTTQIKKLMETGAKDYLIKPIDVVQFLKIVDECLSKNITNDRHSTKDFTNEKFIKPNLLH